jgi:release factor glutamine methyltransferase
MEVYQPSEDSFFLSEILEQEIMRLAVKKSEIKLLDIGCGSGIQLKAMCNAGAKKENIFSCDINSEAVRCCKKLGFHSVRSDLFEKIKGKFDVIAFNPPYLPAHKFDKKSDTAGGKHGSEVINKFLKQAKSHLTKNGKIILVTSSLTKKINWLNYRKKLLGKKKLFFEELYAQELRR